MSSFPNVSCSSMAAAFLRGTVMALPVMRRNEGKGLVRHEVAVWIVESGAGWSAGAQKSPIPDTSTSIADPVEQDGMINIEKHRQ